MIRETLASIILLLTICAAPAWPARGGEFLEELAEQALGGGEPAAAAVAALRSHGAAGVEAMLAAAPPPGGEDRRRWERSLDAVCAQRDCASSGLFWHTDLDRALDEAARAGRPVLSLRLLGRLDEEVSCANSRFFRTVLYPDPQVAARLRDRFVLHWQTERPVPRITIDYGDGRVLRGTVTGNSVHYVLDSRGRLVDALPGLYGPGLFLDVLERARGTALRLAGLEGDAHASALAASHRRALALRERELAGFGGLPAVLAVEPTAGPFPTARQAGRLALTKSMSQQPVLDAVSLGSGGGARPSFDWAPLVERHRSAWTLSAASRRLLIEKHRRATGAASAATVAAFEEVLGLDTVRNEYLLHTLVHSWLADPGAAGVDLEAFNARVYAELFLTPSSDPWLGLRSPETYLALAPEPAPDTATHSAPADDEALP